MAQKNTTKIVAWWVIIGVGMLVVQVLLGGITRLTGSGLSITEWKPLMGAMPPTSQAEWQQSFEKYQQIAQYKYLNQHFSLGDFKFIFFWEWFHRLWARIIGLVFLIPFIYFLSKGYFKKWMVLPLVVLFLLGAMQGAVGWLMVKSGLNDSDLYVSHIRLAVHFMSAMILISYAVVFGLKLVVPQHQRVVASGIQKWAIFITSVLCVQLVYGAFMAGMKAANVAPTWPDINGEMIPGALFTSKTIAYDIVHNKITVHFIHRTMAYLLTIGIFVWWLKARKVTYSPAFNFARNSAIILVLLQVTLGILSVVTSPYMVAGSFGTFEWMAQLHQLVGMLLLLSFVSVIYISSLPATLAFFEQTELKTAAFA